MNRFVFWVLTSLLAGVGSMAWAGLPSASADLEQCSAKGAAASRAGYAIAAQKSVADHHGQMAELHGWLMKSMAPQGLAKGVQAPLDRADRVALGLDDCVGCAPRQADQRRFQVGVGKPIGLQVDFSSAALKSLRGGRAIAEGYTRASADGGFVWTIKLSSPGAAGLRVGLSGLDLPPQAALYVFNERGEAFGPYHDKGALGSGEVVTNMLSGDSLYLQFHLSSTPKSLDRLRFRIDDIGHISSRFALARDLDAFHRLGKAHCTSGIENAQCVENAECFSTGDFAAIDDVRDAVAAMLFRSGGGYYICSGGLIANDAGDPLFLTANHCISKRGEASSLEVYWNHAVSCGTSTCSGAWAVQGRASDVGAELLANGRTGDYSLMRLASTLPSGAFALGWTSSPVASSNNAELYRISHPQGAPQAFSVQQVSTNAGTCGTLPRGDYIYSRDTTGATEGGSSGSPVLNAAGEIVGQLYGACGTNLNDVCDSGSNATVDGAFAGYFNAVEPFLVGGGGDPGDPGGDFTLSGQGSKVQGRWVADLSWSGSSAGGIDVRRDGSLIATVANTGSYTDATGMRGGGSLSYQVCEAGTSICSNSITLNF